MIVNVLMILLLLMLAGLFVFLSVRAGQARRAWVKWPGMILAGLLGLLLLAVGGVAALGEYRLNVAPYTYSLMDVQVAGTPEQIARGERLAYICVDCHSSTAGLPLDGSKANLITPAVPPMGVLWAPNLTPAGPLRDWTDGEIMRAIREGVDKNDRPLFGMTSEPFSHWSDEDVQALVAYLRSQPPVERAIPARSVNVLASIFVGAGLAPTAAQPPVNAPVTAPAPGSSEYGRYLIYTTGCRDCHGPELTGTTNPFVPTGPNLTQVMPNWSEEQFKTFFRTGVNNTGRQVETANMPWKSFNNVFSDDDLRDLYTYLHGLPLAQTAK